MTTKLEAALPRAAGKPWSVPEAAGFLGISARTLWRLIDAGEVKVVRIGRRVLVPDAAVRQLAAGEGN
jgi:excisionase family DNA binding protein